MEVTASYHNILQGSTLARFRKRNRFSLSRLDNDQEDGVWREGSLGLGALWQARWGIIVWPWLRPARYCPW